MTHYTPHQKGIIKRYYEHADTIALQKLSEIVSDLYLAETKAAKDRLWKRAETALAKLPGQKRRMELILQRRDHIDLAQLISELS